MAKLKTVKTAGIRVILEDRETGEWTVVICETLQDTGDDYRFIDIQSVGSALKEWYYNRAARTMTVPKWMFRVTRVTTAIRIPEDLPF